MPVGADYSIDECILALTLYEDLKKAGSPMNENSPEVVDLTEFISKHVCQRKPKSICNKLKNFQYWDTAGLHGLKNGGRRTEFVWMMFHGDMKKLSREAAAARSRIIGRSRGDEELYSGSMSFEDGIILAEAPRGIGGFEKQYVEWVRINQDSFRADVLRNFNDECCITGMGGRAMLEACHIRPWRNCDGGQRTDVRNGLCLTPVHHLAFDHGYFTIDEDYRVLLSPSIGESVNGTMLDREFRPYEGREILSRGAVPVSQEYLGYHRKKIFVGERRGSAHGRCPPGLRSPSLSPLPGSS